MKWGEADERHTRSIYSGLVGRVFDLHTLRTVWKCITED
jgi:hypothetical protein